jgi:photosystem II stability/assembly factor-like uncharacterized protein
LRAAVDGSFGHGAVRMRSMLRRWIAAGTLLLIPACALAQKLRWEVQTSGVDTNLRAVSVAREPNVKSSGTVVVWASGSNGVILKSVDEGKSWARLHVEGGDSLDFRGIVAFSANVAYVMSSGEGEKSTIYKTTDGGQTWTLQYTDKRTAFFLDSIACVSEKECLALGDPIDRKFVLLKMADGEHWSPLARETMPSALGSEGAFAASNSCLVLSGDKEIFFGTGGPSARVFHSTDGGLTWNVARTLILQGNPSSGIFSLGADVNGHVVAVGGDYKEAQNSDSAASYSMDAAKSWQLSEKQPGGFRSGVAHVDGGLWVAVGPTGEEISTDHGSRWKHTDGLNLNAVTMQDSRTGWAVGPKGTIARFELPANH